MKTVNVNVAVSIGGVAVQGSVARSAEGQIGQEVTLAVAQAGTLSTRTSDTAGTLTLSADHGITDADVIDIFWTDDDGNLQCAYGATVGTVSGTSVPFTGASGTVLPAEDSTITACVVTEINVDFDGDDAKLVFLKSTRQGHANFVDSGDASLEAITLDVAAEPWFWIDGLCANPLTGNPVDALIVSNADANNEATVSLAVLYDSVA